MTTDYFYLFLIWNLFSVFVLKNPWITYCSPTYHYSVTPCVLFNPLNIGNALYITITNNGYFYSLLYLCNCIPVRLTKKELRPCSTMNSNERRSIIFQYFSYLIVIS